MNQLKKQIAEKQITSVTKLSILINLSLSVLKFFIGLLSGSMALTADGFHSLSDMATDITVLLGFHIGSKEPDQSHPYGHGRAETFSAVLIALVMILAGGAMIYYAAIDMAKGNVRVFSISVVTTAVISVVVKELLYKVTKKAATKSHSPALYANAWHHRSDALSSVAVLIGILTLKAGFDYGDQIAAIAVGLMIILAGAVVLGNCFREFTESAVDVRTIEHIEQIIAADSSIRGWHKLRTRFVGREIFLDLHILVDPDLNIAAAHNIAENLENALHQGIYRPVNITVHIEPDIPDLRK